jgi:hypothetical protein
MKKKNFGLGILVIVLVFGVTIVGCKSAVENAVDDVINGGEEIELPVGLRGTWSDGTNTLVITTTTIRQNSGETYTITSYTSSSMMGITLYSLMNLSKSQSINLQFDEETGKLNITSIMGMSITFGETYTKN